MGIYCTLERIEAVLTSSKIVKQGGGGTNRNDLLACWSFTKAPLGSRNIEMCRVQVQIR
jgi:hypothetical protein